MAASTGSGNYDVVVQAYNANTFATISSGDTVTLTDNVTGCNFFKIEAGATLVCNGFSITVDNDSSNHSFINNGTISGVLDVIITNPNGQSNFNANGQGGNVRNLTVNNAGAVVTLSGEDQTLDGDLTITAGQLTTNDGSADRNLTVTGDASVTGTLTGNASAISFGSLTINSGGTYSATSGTTTITSRLSGQFSLSNAGTFTNNDGTVLFSGAVDQHVSFTGSGNMHHCTVNKSDNDLVQRSNLTIEGDLNITTVSSHDFRGNTGTHTLDVTGDVTLSAGRFGGNTTYTANHSYGSLTINSGAEWKATSGTTTITGEASGGFAINHDGTFTHNKGTVKLDFDTSTNFDLTGTSGNLYNLIVDSDGTVGYNLTTLENNLTKLGSGLMRPTGDSGRNMTVKGTFLMQAGSFGRGASDTNTNTFGNIVVEGGELILTGGGGSGKTIVNGSFRNVGGTITSH